MIHHIVGFGASVVSGGMISYGEDSPDLDGDSDAEPSKKKKKSLLYLAYSHCPLEVSNPFLSCRSGLLSVLGFWTVEWGST